jgi:hypothetical protein
VLTFTSVWSLSSTVNPVYGLVQPMISMYQHLPGSMYHKPNHNKVHPLLPQDQMMIAREEQQQRRQLNRTRLGGRRSMMMHKLALERIKGDRRRHRENTRDNNKYKLNRDLGRLSKPLSKTRDGDFLRCH